MKRRCSRSEVVRDGGDAVEFSVERQPVIVTRVANADTVKYTVVPKTTDGCTEGVVINAWAPWLGKALSVKEEPDRDILAHFVQDVIRALLAQALMTDTQRARPSLEGSDDSPAPNGRTALGLLDDAVSEEEPPPAQPFLTKTFISMGVYESRSANVWPPPLLRPRLNQSRYPARLTVLSCAFDRFTPALSCAFDCFSPALPFGPFHSASHSGRTFTVHF